jgi:transcriptional regulator with XRE-family HTH domain
MSFSRKLRDLRREKELTQAEIGDAIGVHKRIVSTWENERVVPSLGSLMALSKFLRVSMDYLMFDNVPREGVEAINDFELYEYFRKAESLPTEMKQAVKEILDALVVKQKVKGIPELDTLQVQKADESRSLRKIAGRR